MHLPRIGIVALGTSLALATAGCPSPKMPSGPPPEYEEPPPPPWLTDAGSLEAEPPTEPPASPEPHAPEPADDGDAPSS